MIPPLVHYTSPAEIDDWIAQAPPGTYRQAAIDPVSGRWIRCERPIEPDPPEAAAA